jgi:type VI secretion system protein ImpH
MTVGVIGLTGPSGVLPRLYTDTVTTTLRGRSHALHDFLDLLSHRLVALFAGAGSKYRPHRAAELAALAEPRQPDPTERLVISLAGHGTPHMAERMAAGTEVLLHYAGFFAAHPRSAERLAALASDWLGQTVQVDQFAGAWLSLGPQDRSRLPRAPMAGAWNRLGVDAAIGVRAWDLQGRLVLRIGPLARPAFEALLPDRPALARLVALVRAFLPPEVGFAINPVLAPDAVPPLRLDRGADPGPRLGWTTWLPLTAAPRGHPAGEAQFEETVVEAEAR